VTTRPRGAPGGSPTLLLAALAVFILITVDVLAGGPLTHLDRAVSDWAKSTGLPAPGWRTTGQMEADQAVNFGDRDVVGLIVLVAIAYLSARARTIVRSTSLSGRKVRPIIKRKSNNKK